MPYRVTGAEVRHAIGNRSARQALRKAAEAREEAAATVRELDEQEHERVRQRRRSRAAIRKQKLRALARLPAEGKTQRAAAAELDVSERTIHRWMPQPGFAHELTKATSRHERDLKRERKREQTRRNHNERRRLRRHNPELYYELYSPATPPERRRAAASGGPGATRSSFPAPGSKATPCRSSRTRAKASDSGSPTTRRANSTATRRASTTTTSKPAAKHPQNGAPANKAMSAAAAPSLPGQSCSP